MMCSFFKIVVQLNYKSSQLYPLFHHRQSTGKPCGKFRRALQAVSPFLRCDGSLPVFHCRYPCLSYTEFVCQFELRHSIAAAKSVRTIKQTGQFKRDLKREAKGKHRATLENALIPVLIALASDTPLAPRYRDHALTGDWKDHRDCHVMPDLVLIYQKPNEETL